LHCLCLCRGDGRRYSHHDVLELFSGSRPRSRGGTPRAKSNGGFLDFQYYDGPEGNSLRTKADVLRSLAFCSGGLITSFLIWGILQERMLTMPYR
jgi:hypothetical protein